MFDKILIANRGEIACRVIKTARRLGIRTVALYSDADRDALHVSQADEAVHIGAAPARDSYLDINKVLAAAEKTGAQAIHPGYGFLSENADFARRCEQQGLVFIGPPAAAIDAMGSKAAAKRIMEKAGVPLVPGYHGDDQSAAVLKQAADDMSYPVLLKATAGGGGKGMRQVWSADEFDEALAAAKREAANAFGDERMLVEKYLTQPRHVEIQVFCDQQGNGVFLFERDCSVQRRHQKVIEEAPAPGMTDKLREQMGAAAVRAAQAIDYCGAGTVEFLLDSDGAFYFMEMNTRLQVEHPVTEMISGQDLVEWQLRVAAGESLPLTQSQLQINGHAFEARIYAEDPANDFLPQTGTLHFLQAPMETDHVRIDTGVREGDEVSVYYDPMIAKLVTWDEDRDKALRRLNKALSEYCISGVTTNIDFLYNLASSEPFGAADLDTGFIERRHDAIFHDRHSDVHSAAPLAALTLLLEQQQQSSEQAARSHDPHSPWHNSDGWRLNQPSRHSLELCLQEQTVTVSIQPQRHGNSLRYTMEVGDDCMVVAGSLDGQTLHAEIDGHRQQATVARHDNRYSLYTADRALSFYRIMPDLGDADAGSDAGALTAPMNGTIVSHLVEPGAVVSKGDALLVMEAMKMEHTIRAPADGVLQDFYFQPGELVNGGAELVKFEVAENE